MCDTKFLAEICSSGAIQKLQALKVVPAKTVRNLNMFFKYDSYLKSGYNVNSAVFLTARHFNLNESTVYRVVKKLERGLN